MVKISFQHIKEKYGRFILVGLCVFLIGLVIHFPVHRLAPMITSMIERNSGYQIQASQMSIVMPFGLSMKDVWIQGPPIMNVPVNHKFESVKLYPSISSLLTYVAKKSLGVSFKADRGAEKWNGSVALGPKYTDVSLRGSDLDYSFIVPLEQYNPMLAGQTVTISSRFRFELDFEAPTPDLQLGDFTKATGALSLLSKDTFLENIMVGELQFNDTKLESELTKGNFQVDDFHLNGEKLQINLSGILNLQKAIDTSKIDKADIRIFIDPSLSQLSNMVNLLASMNQITVHDSVMNFRISGPVNNIQKWRVTNL